MIDFYLPTAEDGFAVNRLIAASPPLDTNSVYCNLLQCTHFADTSICAKSEGKLSGFISGYLIPFRPNTLFIWQIVVAESVRGRGLAVQMIHELLLRPACQDVEYLETTITRSNEASWALFARLSKDLGADAEVSVAFANEEHFHGGHETEQLLRMGPFSQVNLTRRPT